MELSIVLQKRLTILQYQKQEVALGKIEQILEAGRIAPSSKNKQPWRFYHLTQEQKEYIATLMEQYELDPWEKKYLITTSKERSARVLRTVGNAILIYNDRPFDEQDRIYRKDMLKSYYLSIGACIENMILKATELELGSTWLCDVLFVQDKINTYLGIEDKELMCGLAIGYPKEMPKPKGRYPINYLTIC